MCPNCHVQYDRYHDIISATAHEEYPFVHLHVQQLLALALGADPEKDVGVQSHSQNVEPFLERIGARAGGSNKVIVPVTHGGPGSARPKAGAR